LKTKTLSTDINRSHANTTLNDTYFKIKKPKPLLRSPDDNDNQNFSQRFQSDVKKKEKKNKIILFLAFYTERKG